MQVARELCQHSQLEAKVRHIAAHYDEWLDEAALYHLFSCHRYYEIELLLKNTTHRFTLNSSLIERLYFEFTHRGVMGANPPLELREAEDDYRLITSYRPTQFLLNAFLLENRGILLQENEDDYHVRQLIHNIESDRHDVRWRARTFTIVMLGNYTLAQLSEVTKRRCRFQSDKGAKGFPRIRWRKTDVLRQFCTLLYVQGEHGDLDTMQDVALVIHYLIKRGCDPFRKRVGGPSAMVMVEKAKNSIVEEGFYDRTLRQMRRPGQLVALLKGEPLPRDILRRVGGFL
jgi:hypothetical protein